MRGVHVRWLGQTCGALGLALNFLCYFLCFKTKKVKGPFSKRKNINLFNKFYVLSFACVKERMKEKHSGHDIQPLPDALNLASIHLKQEGMFHPLIIDFRNL